MGKRNLTIYYGYTLMELMISLAMISVITTIAVPSYIRYIASTKEKACMINRQTIIYEYQLFNIDNPDITLSDFISKYYAGREDKLCPSGGTYDVDDSEETSTLTCSMHHKLISEDEIKSLPEEFQEPLLNPITKTKSK